MSAPSGPSDPRDPVRWHEDPSAPGDLAADLRAARKAAPSPAEIDAIAKSIHKVGGPAPSDVPPAPGGPTAPNAPPPTQAYWYLGAKFWAAVLVPVCVAAFWWGRSSRPDAPTAIGNDAPQVTQPEHTQSSLPARAPDPRTINIAPVQRATPLAASPSPAADPSPRPPAPPPCVEDDHRARVSRAQSMVASGAHRAALVELNRDRGRCPRGAMSEDRERLAIEALLRSGQEREARARWTAFRRSFPRSLYTRPLGVMLSGEQR